MFLLPWIILGTACLFAGWTGFWVVMIYWLIETVAYLLAGWRPGD